MINPPSGLMHGNNVRLTIYTGTSPRPVQITGPVTAEQFDDAGRITSLRFENATVFDGRLADVMTDVGRMAEGAHPDIPNSAPYRAVAGTVAGMLGALQPVDRAPTPAEPRADRFGLETLTAARDSLTAPDTALDVESVRARLRTERQQHQAQYDKMKADATSPDPSVSKVDTHQMQVHYAAAMALTMALDVLAGSLPTIGTYNWLLPV
jgi:hypothetical protein